VAEQHDDGGLTALVMQCAFAVLAGQPTVTISTTSKVPPGFPRGELLSVGTNGSHNYAVDPVKALAWIHAQTSRRAAGVPEAVAPKTDHIQQVPGGAAFLRVAGVRALPKCKDCPGRASLMCCENKPPAGVRVCDTAAYCASVRRCTRADTDRSLKCAVVPGVAGTPGDKP
jgi:hypothetical protein